LDTGALLDNLRLNADRLPKKRAPLACPYSSKGQSFFISAKSYSEKSKIVRSGRNLKFYSSPTRNTLSLSTSPAQRCISNPDLKSLGRSSICNFLLDFLMKIIVTRTKR
jgi:hypothetical protein